MFSRRSVLSSILLVLSTQFTQAQSTRLSDKDLKQLMENVHKDAESFVKNLDKALSKSSIRKTSREKEVKQTAKLFVEQVEGMKRTFDDKRKADTTLPVVYQSVSKLDQGLSEAQIQGQAAAQWSKLKSDLGRIADQFGYVPPSL